VSGEALLAALRKCLRATLADVLVAFVRGHLLTLAIAILAYASDWLWPMSAYGAAVITWPIAAVVVVLALVTASAAMPEHARTQTFLPLSALAFALGPLFALFRLSPTWAALVCLAALSVSVRRRTPLLAAVPTVTSAFAALAALAVDVPKIRTRQSLEIVLPTYAAAALLLLVWPHAFTRGNRRLFGLVSLAAAAATSYVVTFDSLYATTSEPVAIAAALTMCAAFLANLWSGFRHTSRKVAHYD